MFTEIGCVPQEEGVPWEGGGGGVGRGGGFPRGSSREGWWCGPPGRRCGSPGGKGVVPWERRRRWFPGEEEKMVLQGRGGVPEEGRGVVVHRKRERLGGGVEVVFCQCGVVPPAASVELFRRLPVWSCSAGCRGGVVSAAASPKIDSLLLKNISMFLFF